MKALAAAAGAAACIVAQCSPLDSPVHVVALLTAIVALGWVFL